MFNNNVGSLDRALRIIVGVGLLFFFFYMPEAPWRYWLLIGIVPLFTGLFGTCPLYSVFGFSSCPVKRT